MMQVDNIFEMPGAYVLLMELSAIYSDDIGALGNVKLSAGYYLYFGSARGKGGMAARVRRHLKINKKRYWHVDWMTLAGSVKKVMLVPGGLECELRRKASALSGLTVPILGFGSSDCNQCPAHLLGVKGNGLTNLEELRLTVSGHSYSVTSFFSTTAAQPSTV